MSKTKKNTIAIIFGVLFLVVGLFLFVGCDIFDGNQTTQPESEIVAELKDQLDESAQLLKTSEELVKNLQEQVDGLKIELENETDKTAEKQQRVETLETSIVSLNEQIQNLRNEVARLEGLIQSYEEMSRGTYEVNFYISENELLTTKAIVKDTSMTQYPEAPAEAGYTFAGWSLDGVNVVSSELVISENTNLYAVFEAQAGAFSRTGEFLESWESLVSSGKVVVKDGELDYVGSDCLYEVIRIGEDIQEIGANAFMYREIKEVYVSDSVYTISSGAFMYSSLEKIEFGANVQKVDYNVFNRCENLISIKLNDGLVEIGVGAFWGCSQLTEIVLPSTVTKLGAEAFNGCTELEKIYLPASLTTMINTNGAVVDMGTDSWFSYCEKLTIYYGAEEKPVNLLNYWNHVESYLDSDVYAPVVWGCSYEEYLAKY